MVSTVQARQRRNGGFPTRSRERAKLELTRYGVDDSEQPFVPFRALSDPELSREEQIRAFMRASKMKNRATRQLKHQQVDRKAGRK